MSARARVVAFGKFKLDPGRRLLLADGRPVAVNARAFDILELLVRCADRVVTKDEIVGHVWRGMIVSDNNLTVQMSTLRRALAEHAGAEPLIVTIPGRGYQFVGLFHPEEPLSEVLAPAAPDAAEAAAGDVLEAPRAVVLPALGGARSWQLLVMVSVAGMLALAGGIAAYRSMMVPAPPRLSIAVLPFRNLSPDRAQDYLAEAISDDLTTDLAHIPGSVVIARDSAEAFKNRNLSVQAIGRALGVRYLLEGSVRPEAHMDSINAQLIDAVSGTQLWAERFDDPRSLIAESRDTIVRRIGSALGFELEHLESAKSVNDRPDDLDAQDLFFRARAMLDWDDSLAGFSMAQHLLEQAIAKRPNFGDAEAELAWMLLRKVQTVHDPDEEKDYAEARQAIQRAIALVPRNAKALAARGRQMAIEGRCAEAEASAATALAIQPSSVEGHTVLANCAWKQGNLQAASSHMQAVLRLSPDSPTNKPRYQLLAHIELLEGHADEALRFADLTTQGDAEPAPGAETMGRAEQTAVVSIAAYAMAGDMDHARALYAAYDKIWPNRSVWRFAEHYTKAVGALPGFLKVEELLHAAGMPVYADDSVTAPPGVCKAGDYSPTPATAPGAFTVTTQQVADRLAQGRAGLIIDVGRGVAAVPGAVWFDPRVEAGTGDQFADRLLASRAPVNRQSPVIVMSDGPFGCDSYQTAAHLAAEGYSAIAWYRGGEEDWARAGHPADDHRLQ
jgi:TolB-like protein/DNA-binding winged helix-turn-helix (wHTH) protein/thioredoxin-like negative regulator of GroEL/rhodanese-related sulfurtransferase